MTQQTPATFSDKGLASYGEASEDYELAPIGIASMPEQVKRLAEFGRNGDIYVIHAAEGETVIPMEVLDANPQIKALLFNQMEEMGLDPERYIIGNELNSINPVTGMPEFFSFNPFKAVKKVVKKVVNIAKKIAPIALPLIGATIGIPFLPAAFFGPGMMGSMALTSGIGTLIGGGSLKDAFKSALISGGTTGILQGFGGMKGGKGWAGFKKGFTDAAYNPEYAKLVEAQALREAATKNLAGSSALKLDPRATFDVNPNPLSQPNVGDNYLRAAPDVSSVQVPVSNDLSGALSIADPALPASLPPPSTTTGDLTFGRIQPVTSINAPTALDARTVLEIGDTAASTEPWLDKLSPSKFIKGYTDILGEPSNIKDLALIGGGLYAGGAFTPAEEEDPKEVQQAALDALDPIVIDPLAAQAAQIDVTTQIPTTTAEELLQPSIFAAQGGAVSYPRREALVEGPGTTTSDDIPAMLSDGEFVINSKAVQGADPSGRGNRYAGAQNLYNMMRNFEMRA